MRITLPWPVPILSPNVRAHWAAKARATASYRKTCGLMARAAGVWPSDAESIKMTLTFCPPDRRRRDEDNIIRATKALRDGLQDALGVDDNRFSITYEIGDVIKGGAVIVDLPDGL